MNRDKLELWESLVDLADGASRPQVDLLISQDSTLRKQFLDLKRMLDGLKLTQYSAPGELKKLAKSLMAFQVLPMRCIKSTLQLMGARSATQDFQVVYGNDLLELRVMYTKVDNGWEVMSKIPESSWSVSRDQKELSLDSNQRFQFISNSLENTCFSLQNLGLKLEIPNVSELIDES